MFGNSFIQIHIIQDASKYVIQENTSVYCSLELMTT
jgi:hypothetical protein